MKKILFRKMQAAILTFAMMAGLLSAETKPVTVQAAGTIKTINIGAANLAPSGGIWDAASDHKVYFGRYGDKPTAFRVLKVDTGKMMLDCDTVLLDKKFDADEWENEGQEKCNAWKNSDLEVWLNGDEYYGNSSVFTSTEKDAIVQTTLSVGDSSGYQDYEATDYIYLLSVSEARNLYADDTARKKTDGKSWFLRSAYSGQYPSIYVGRVDVDGSIGRCTVETYNVGASPALNLDLSSVLFTTASGVNKASDTLTQVTTDSDAREWKLTLADHSKQVAVTEGKSVTKSGNTVTVPYTYTGSDVSQISVMITSGSYQEAGTEILYYGRLNTALSATGTGTVTLPDGLPAGYKIYIMAEDVNDGNNTDYASEPIELTVNEMPETPNKPTETESSDPTTTGGDDATEGVGTVSDITEKEENFGATGLLNTEEELKEIALTEEDKAAYAAGKKITLKLVVDDISDDVSKVDKELVEEKLPEAFVAGAYLDINLWKTVDGNATKVTKLPNGRVKVRITVPKELQKTNRSYLMVRIHEGTADILDATFDESTCALVFETDKFSTYALVYKDTDSTKTTGGTDNAGSTENTANTGSSQKDDEPKTGDTVQVEIYATLAMIAGMSYLILLFGNRKRA